MSTPRQNIINAVSNVIHVMRNMGYDHAPEHSRHDATLVLNIYEKFLTYDEYDSHTLQDSIEFLRECGFTDEVALLTVGNNHEYRFGSF